MADHNDPISPNDPHILPPPIPHSSTSLFRQPTRNDTSISYQSSVLDPSLALKEPFDILEKSLSAKSEDPLIQKLQNDYSDFKSRPCRAFFRDRVSVLTFHLPSTRTICYPSVEIEDPEETFSDCIEKLTMALREGADTECVRTWYEPANFKKRLLLTHTIALCQCIQELRSCIHFGRYS